MTETVDGGQRAGRDENETVDTMTVTLDDKSEGLVCLCLNADGLLNKRTELEGLIVTHAPDIICITEIAPKNSLVRMSSSEIQLNGYSLHTNEESMKRGVAIYSKCSLNGVPQAISTTFEESCWIRLRLRGRDELLIGCVYRSPNSEEANNDVMLAMLPLVCQMNYTHLLICGDFNLPGIIWTDMPTSRGGVDSLPTKFLECLNDCFLFQHVTLPTHHRPGQRANTLDLVMTNENDMIVDLEHTAPLGKSDHDCLKFIYRCYASQKGSTRTNWNLNRGDYAALRRRLAEYNFRDLEFIPIDDAWKKLHSAIIESMEATIPKIRFRVDRKRRPQWITAEVLKKIKEKNRMHRAFKRSGRDTDYIKYCRLRNQTRWETRRAKVKFEKDLASNAKQNPKAVFKYVNSRLKTQQNIPDLDLPNGIAQSDVEKAEALNTFFTSVFTQEDRTLPTIAMNGNNTVIPDLVIEQATVEKKLAKLKIDKSAGPDDIHPRILREIAPVISKPLADLMQNSLTAGQLPSLWKDANITALHKKGQKSSPTNYRPVSLTCQLCKVMESIIRDHILQYLDTYNIISPNQHGFTPKRSCASQLIECIEDWLQAVDDGVPVDIIYLDFQKAFDSVPHQRLLAKMEGIGITGQILEWCRDFLYARRQRVVLNGAFSQWTSVLSGVPQGSVLGPTLFVIFIDDMVQETSSSIKLFADDAKVYRNIKTIQDTDFLQDDIYKLVDWAKRWQMRFNPSKCQTLHLGWRNERHMYSIDGVQINSTDCVRDLGVLVTETLDLQEHTRACVAKANRTLGILRRSFDHMDQNTLSWLFKALVRPHLEYCHSVTHPTTERDMSLLEGVQRRATKLITALRDLPYESRLRTLQLPSIKYRLLRGDLIEIYKYTHNMIKSMPKSIKINRDITRGHTYKLEKPRCRTSARAKSFPHRAINTWNTLTEHVVTAPSINSFKQRLDKQLRHLHYVY